MQRYTKSSGVSQEFFCYRQDSMSFTPFSVFPAVTVHGKNGADPFAGGFSLLVVYQNKM
jgi:hypothetical protein